MEMSGSFVFMFTKEGKEKMKELRRKMEARTPAEVEADLAKIRKEKAEREAMTSLADAEESEVVESREKKELRDITYFQVDDEPGVLKITERALENIGLNQNKNKQGECGTVEDFKQWMKSLVQSKDPLDVIILDRAFPRYIGEDVEDFASWQRALRYLDDSDMRSQDGYKEVLGNTKVIIMSGDTIGARELRQIREKFPRVIGALDKTGGDDITADNFKKILEDAEIVKKED